MDVYGGSAPESEVETNNIMQAVIVRANNLQISVDLHSFGQLWLLPYGGNSTKPDDYYELVRDYYTIFSSRNGGESKRDPLHDGYRWTPFIIIHTTSQFRSAHAPRLTYIGQLGAALKELQNRKGL